MNELVNYGTKLSKLEINTSFIKGLPKKWLSFCQILRNTNHVKDSELASLFGKLKYEENLIDNIYETKKKKSLTTTTPLSTAFFLTFIVQDFQDSPDDEEDTRSILAPQLPNHQWSRTKGIVAEAYEWDEEEVSSDDNEMVEVKVLMALVDDENIVVGKESAKNEQRNDLVLKHRNLVHELNQCKEQLLVLQQAKLDFLTMQHVNTEILTKNKNLRIELKELTAITETWLNSSNKVNQCISEQIPSQKKRILGLDQLTEDPSSSGQTDLVFVKSSAEDIKVSIPGVERPWLSKAKGFILPNHDTGRILPSESQVNTIDPSVAVTDSLTTEYDSADESLVGSTTLPPLEKLAGAEPVSGPKTIKSILKLNSTFKAEALKGVTINEPPSAPAKTKASTSKANSAPAGKLKNVKTEDDFPLASVMKELNDLKIISLRRGIKPINPQHVMKSYKTCGSIVHTTTDHNDIEWFRRGKTLQAKKSKALKSTKAEL
ncbi:hypothetical protein Tco_1407982 [Tanacetum coccineum]